MTAPIRILVVDDEAPQMRALCDTLRDHGYDTVGCPGGAAALAEIAPGRFDLLLTDLMMPEMDGIALLHAALAVDPDLVGILMTGAGTIASAVEAMKAGAFDYLLKPFKLRELLPVLARALLVRSLRVENAALQAGMRERTTQLEEANRELEAYSYSVSHDLRAPLRSIAGFSQALSDDAAGALSAEAQGHLERIRAAAKRMGQLIDGLLALSQLGRRAVRRAPVDLSALAGEVLARLREADPQRSVEVVVQAGMRVEADAHLLEAVIENLLANAWKFTRDQPRARIEVTCVDGTCQVRDNGAGFDMAHAGKLFGTFQRLHSSSAFEGTGIGLATVQRIIARHGGRVWAEGEVGRGAVFSFTLAQAATTPGRP
jgi:signal transduction histidine kinase